MPRNTQYWWHVMVSGSKTSVCAYLDIEEGRSILTSFTVKGNPYNMSRSCNLFPFYVNRNTGQEVILEHINRLFITII